MAAASAPRWCAGLLDIVRAQGLTVKPLCPFVAGYIAKHPEYADLLG